MNTVRFFRRIFSFFFQQGEKSIIFFTDCSDSNAIARVSAHLVARNPNYQTQVLGINSCPEAALNIENILEVWRKANSTGNVVVGNIAPRTEKQWQNGAPFCYCWISGNLVVATPACFSILIKQDLIPGGFIYETDVEIVCSKFLSKQEAEEISKTQFRSLWYVPLLIQWILQGKEIPFQFLDVEKHVPKIEKNTIFLIDNFGNIKLSIDTTDVKTSQAGKNFLKVGNREYKIPLIYERLSNVPVGGIGFVVGSGGGFCELQINGGSAAIYFSAKVGEKIEFV